MMTQSTQNGISDTVAVKYCRQCQETKPRTDFSPNPQNKTDGLQTLCRTCRNANLRGEPPSQPIAEPKECHRCKETKATTDFHSDRSRPGGLSHYCKDCSRILSKERNARKRPAYQQEVIVPEPETRIDQRRSQRIPAAPPTTGIPMIVLPSTPQFIPVGRGGFSVNHVVTWEPIANGDIQVTLAVNDWNRQGHYEARKFVLERSHQEHFFAAIHTLMPVPDSSVVDRLKQERDSAITLGSDAERERAAWEQKYKELLQQTTQQDAHIARLRRERDEAQNTLDALRKALG